MDWHRVITTEQAAAILGVSVKRVQQLVAEGHLSAHKPGRDLLIDRHEVEQMASQPRPKRGPKPATP